MITATSEDSVFMLELERKLDLLNESKDSIHSTSILLVKHLEKSPASIDDVITLWARKAFEATRESKQQLAYVYLANEVIQICKRSTVDSHLLILKALGKVAAESFVKIAPHMTHFY